MSNDASQEIDDIDACDGEDDPEGQDQHDGKGRQRRDRIRTVCAVIVAAAATWQSLRNGL